ncbi:MAG: polyprenol monophosphomannose synthase [Candidatus Omnitrophica bacterium CG11_big_fil_rev_8_21_14_0_20_45_26]|uniref:Polyprenol monophosphomannose synthase n=1 Tax=Candidatus Abzuiibacterium crystallinum TaxID=1974748 RepID=A0A2H0LLG4_9BACT|nr:MAG: polyprenol monophosphomannose synthase [Candidatus Omnitrophica bacterium CG11_big_fil_rev_8_21_14_0_20_45_26]PIW64511.1 MAG: polyprenol monophosphomannose synthase [Candidatus Omnitrophica bacterium CG12_big_fil_rev_8_21_14_0_65_45_16]
MFSHSLISIVLATYNEAESILDTIHALDTHVGQPLEIIVVDDNSPDGTWDVVQKANLPYAHLIRRTNERGLASAFWRGVQEARGDYIGWMDADMSMPPALLPVMFEALKQADIAVGSRYVKGGRDERTWLRVRASQCINGLARLVLNRHIYDFDSGFALVKKEVIQAVPFRAKGYGEYFMEFLYAAAKKGFQIKEVPYVFCDRLKGTSKSAPSMSHFLKTGVDYIVRIFVARFRN